MCVLAGVCVVLYDMALMPSLQQLSHPPFLTLCTPPTPPHTHTRRQVGGDLSLDRECAEEYHFSPETAKAANV